MSGLKCSSFELEAAQLLRNQSLFRFGTAQRQLPAILQEIATLQAKLAAWGSPAQAQASKEWVAQVQSDPATRRQAGAQHATDEITTAATRLENLAGAGRTLASRMGAEVERIEAHGREMRRRVAQVSEAWAASRVSILELAGVERAHALEQAIQSSHAINTEEAVAALENTLKQAQSDAAAARARKLQVEKARVVSNLASQAEALRSALRATMASTQDGLRQSLPEEYRELNDVVQTISTALDKVPSDLDLADAHALQAASEALERAVKSGSRAASAWSDACNQAERSRSATLAQIAEIETELNGVDTLLRTWMGAPFVDDLRRQTGVAKTSLESWHLSGSESVEQIHSTLKARLDEAEKLESLGARRQYLVDSLVKACEQLNFMVAEPPHLETEGDPRSRLILVINTFSEGNITFRVTLDSIETDSRYPAEYCFTEFDRLSEHLLNQFGVRTHFQPADGSPRPDGQDRTAIGGPQPYVQSRSARTNGR